MKYSEALRNSFAAVKRDIDEIKAGNSLIDTKLKNSFANFKRDVEDLRKSTEELKARKENSISVDYLNERLGKIDSSVEAIKNEADSKISDIKDGFSKDIERLEKDDKIEDIRSEFSNDIKRLEKDRIKNVRKDFSSDIKRLEKNISENFESDLKDIKSELKALDKARMKNGHIFEKAIDSLKDELDISSKLKKIEKRISKPVIKEVIKKEPVVIKEIIKEKPVIKKVPVKTSKKKEGKGMFTKIVDFFAED